MHVHIHTNHQTLTPSSHRIHTSMCCHARVSHTDTHIHRLPCRHTATETTVDSHIHITQSHMCTHRIMCACTCARAHTHTHRGLYMHRTKPVIQAPAGHRCTQPGTEEGREEPGVCSQWHSASGNVVSSSPTGHPSSPSSLTAPTGCGRPWALT